MSCLVLVSNLSTFLTYLHCSIASGYMQVLFYIRLYKAVHNYEHNTNMYKNV